MTVITLINIINGSTLVSDADLTTITAAMNLILPTFCTSWNINLPKCQFIGKGKPVPSGQTNVYILDNPDVAGAFGYHDEINSKSIGRVFVKVILSNGGGVMSGKSSPVSVSQVISHEIFELLIDPICNSWWNSPDYSSFYAAEVCDPVQGNRTNIFANKTTVAISDWILPAWTDPQNKTGPYNYTRSLKTPFQVDKNGYLIVCTAGAVNYIFGETVPQWLKDAKMKANRLGNRIIGNATTTTTATTAATAATAAIATTNTNKS